jgi:hypothetical protein
MSLREDSTKGLSMDMSVPIISEHGFKRIFGGELIPQFGRDGNINHMTVRPFRWFDAVNAASLGNGFWEKTTREQGKYGVFRARAVVGGARSGHVTSFFPPEWSCVDVMRAIAEAYQTRKGEAAKSVGWDGFEVGECGTGMKIVLELDDAGLVDDAWPLFKKLSVSKVACDKCGRPKQRMWICSRHDLPPHPYRRVRRIFRRLYFGGLRILGYSRSW